MLEKLIKLLESKKKRYAKRKNNQSIRLDRFMWEADDLKIVTPKKNINNPTTESEEK